MHYDFIDKSVYNPFDIPIEFRILEAKKYSLSSPVVVGTDEYVAAKTSRIPQFEIAYGYSFESFCLFAVPLGAGYNTPMI